MMYVLAMYSGLLLSCRLALLALLCRGASSVSSALSVTPSSTWYGDDGSWSAVSIRIGSPQQWVDVLVSTASSETWAVGAGGCDGSSTCTSKRGGLFNSNKSSTWQNEGLFELGLDTQLGFGSDANYGLDVLEFGTTGVALQETMIGAINTTEYLLGFFGLGNVPGNFTNIEVPSPISALENQSIIPSNSYGYTAGAIYQAKSEPCSLTLGGYDANRFIPHNVSFELNPLHQPESWLSSISVASSLSMGTLQNWSSNALQLLVPSNGIYVTIDSSTPFLWLPKSVCESFAQALGLTYNDSLALYTFDGNASRHDDLRNWNLNFTFSLSDTSNPSQIVNITLPYVAFDLQLSYPYIPNTTYQTGNKYYFPLRRAANDTQYVLGRSFLQEAYLITDYERNNFSVHQAVHPANPLGNTSIVNILKPGASPTQPSGGSGQAASTPLSKAVIIGIAVGGGIFLVLVLAALILIHRHRRHATRRHRDVALLLSSSKATSSFSASSSPTFPPPPGTSAGSTTTAAAFISPQTTHPSSPSSHSTHRAPVATANETATPSSAAAAASPAVEADSTPITPRVAVAEISADTSHERFELPGGSHLWPGELDGRSVTAAGSHLHHPRNGRDGGEGNGEGGEKFAGGMGLVMRTPPPPPANSGWDAMAEWENSSGGKCRGSMKRLVLGLGAEKVGDEQHREMGMGASDADRPRNFSTSRTRARFSWETPIPTNGGGGGWG